MYNSCYSLLLPLFSRSVLENDVFLGLLSDEASKEEADRRVVSLHLLLSRGHSPFSPARPTFSNRATQIVLKQVGIDINTGSVSNYLDRYVQYLLNNIFQVERKDFY